MVHDRSGKRIILTSRFLKISICLRLYFHAIVLILQSTSLQEFFDFDIDKLHDLIQEVAQVHSDVQ